MKSRKSKKAFLRNIWVSGILALMIIVATGGIGKMELKRVLAAILRMETAIADTFEDGGTEDPLNTDEGVVQSPEKTPTTESPCHLKVHFIDVGQGDAIFIELPNGQSMLIDAGNADNGIQIRDYIEGWGYTKLDYVIATHPHADHIGGMTAVINNLEIGRFYMPKKEQVTRTFENMLDALSANSVAVYTARSGTTILDEGGLTIRIVAPGAESYAELNNYSAIVHLRYRDTTFLFTGDAEGISEEEITKDIRADVLKVGHHGSDSSTSAAFLSQVNPRYAVISVGEGNTYGHPDNAILSRLEKGGIATYRTDEFGTVVFSSDGSTISVEK